MFNILKLNNKDEHVSRRFVLHLLKDSATFLISQKLFDRSILAETNLYTYVPCFEFEQIDVRKCPSIEFRMCKILMKSKEKLPKLIFSRLGASIKEIVSLDGEFQFTLVDEAQYRRNKKREHSLKNEVYVYVGTDMHLYIPDREIFSVDLNLLTIEPDNAEECSTCTDNNCKDRWTTEFKCPDKLIETVLDMTLQRLGVTRSIKEDSNPNGVEGV